jgi:hypothetical protein
MPKLKKEKVEGEVEVKADTGEQDAADLYFEPTQD